MSTKKAKTQVKLIIQQYACWDGCNTYVKAEITRCSDFAQVKIEASDLWQAFRIARCLNRGKCENILMYSREVKFREYEVIKTDISFPDCDEEKAAREIKQFWKQS